MMSAESSDETASEFNRSASDTRDSVGSDTPRSGLDGSIVAACQNHQIVSFLVVAFAWTWAIWLAGLTLGYGGTRGVQAVGAWGPLIAAALVTKAAGGDVRAWAAQVVPKRGTGLRWYVIALATPIALTQAGVIVGWALGVPVSVADVSYSVFMFVSTLFVAGALEEFGWRGFLQPRLQERRSALFAALVVGFFWAAWHVPMTIGGIGAGYDGGETIAFFIFLPLLSIVMAWIYNSTQGGLLFVMLFHAMVNATPVFEAAESATVMAVAQLAVLLGLPLVIVLYYGREYLATKRPEPRVPGRVAKPSRVSH